MSTTTIRLPDKLKTRVARAAGRVGKTSHSFILDAIAEKTESEERHEEFLAEADTRYANLLSSGKVIPWNEMRTYLEKRLAGGRVKRPVARKVAR